MARAQRSPQQTYAEAAAQFRAGKAARAAKLCDSLLKAQPDHPETLHLKGISLFQLGRLEPAAACLARAAARQPANAVFQGNLARVLAALGRYEEAEARFQSALRLNPASALDHAGLGNLLAKVGRLDEAATHCERALAIDPGNELGRLNLGAVRYEQGRHAEAMAQFEAVVAANPRVVDAWVNLGYLRLAFGARNDALTAFEAALEVDPRSGRARIGQARALCDLDRTDDAAHVLGAAVRHHPRDAEANFHLGVVEGRRGDVAAAAKAIERALVLDPTMFSARWKRALLLPRIYDSADEIADHRAQWLTRVSALAADLDLSTPARIAQAVEAIKSTTNFDLHYQGYDDRAAQEIYAPVLERIAHARFPQFAERPVWRSSAGASGRPRVGFVSAFLYDHTIYKIHNAWIGELCPEIEKRVYYLGRTHDPCVDAVRDMADGFVHETSIETLIETLHGDRLDVLIYTDLGMEPRLQLSSALWLAPIQCNGLGHPITSGLSTITHAITSELMEPPDGDRHYTETLLRLPNTSHCYSLGRIERVLETLDPSPRDDRRVHFLCAQNLQKYLPQFDRVFCDIAEQAPQSLFHFIADQAPGVTAAFRRRLMALFAERGLALDDFCRFNPRMDTRGYLALNRACDVSLDSIWWSGNNTTHEAVACGLPVITFPGPMMRGRHAFAILTAMGMTETIAGDIYGYVSLAARAPNDSEWRRHLREEIARRRRTLFDDSSPIRALERFIASPAPNGGGGA